MGQDFFKNLPSEIILNILTRLPIQTTISCKFVCKPWLDLLMTPEFVKSHLSKSVPGLAVALEKENPKPYKIIEFADELDLNCHERRWNIVLNLDLPFHEPLHSSVNGLLFLCELGFRPRDLFLCNPITREYIMLPSPRQPSSKPMLRLETFGFGVSKRSGQYKVVRIFCEEKFPLPPQFKSDHYECQVYTVGTGSWRRIGSCRPLEFVEETVGAFLNGNLHFYAIDRFSYRISCFDLETELFSTFSPPPLVDSGKCRNLSVLGDCLCVCDNSYERTSGYEIDIWLMKEYGDEKSWTKQFIISKAGRDDFLGYLCPIKVFKDGDILMELGSRKLLYYSSKTKTIRKVSGLDRNIFSDTTIYAPSFLPLKAFAVENVSLF